METWDLNSLNVEPHHPQVLDSEDEGRVIVLQLPAGERLQEHQVFERAWMLVVSGRIKVLEPNGDATDGGPGFLAGFDPKERREVQATEDTRLLLLLSPWPGEGHPSRNPRAAAGEYPPGD
jgi:redox-sensitive bicupin YhaK (pirin superfamily)